MGKPAKPAINKTRKSKSMPHHQNTAAPFTIRPFYEFHISRKARSLYGIDQALFGQTGNVIFSDFFHVRLLAQKLNSKRDVLAAPEEAITAGSLNAMGVIDEINHYLTGIYKQNFGKEIFMRAEAIIIEEVGREDLDAALITFINDFPPLQVYLNRTDAESYLKQKTAGESNRQIALEELLMLFLANTNPAFSPFKNLFDDTGLKKRSAYQEIYQSLASFFKEQPVFGPDHLSLVEMLHTPAVKFPHSLSDQLAYIREHWGYLLSGYIYRLLAGMDFIKEEEKPVFLGPGPSFVPDFKHLAGDEAPERFSDDLDWMPNVVMLAKSSYVWLDQLSKKYARPIQQLDQIPDEELQLLSQRGFNALWLIGLCERSSASQKIKQISGNPEAVSSAYSLYDYTIAHDLGGDPAYENLRDRAWHYHIRLASDMVPNHTGLFSRWVIEHPHWYVQADNPVFPSYSFNGPNLSDDDRVGLFIEDGYWNRSDAAVLFKRVDNHTGSVTYIFHGNDGTSMPWNDTAQLNYLMPEVREAVIRTIIHVARQFPIIRLDAAMTLAKRHFQRLWFPQPGDGGDIPSRSGFAMTNERFNELFPEEFWREVVDRVALEAPDTLLLAEAFWMMEGYFVRTLGMHRVYNSAFMNMLKNEENQKYRQSIKNVLEFNPEIMKRYVNFMNNPDEETAVNQFGKEDKYFGTCTLMATLPGLPMFGHGQVEGFSEKYGMEYKRAYWDEPEDQYLIARHTREIFPLLKKRYLFSEVENFILYDLIGSEGYVNEDVYAFSNRRGDESALILFNNRYQRSMGTIKYSAASAKKSGNQFIQFTLGGAFNLTDNGDRFTIFRDLVSNQEYIRRSSDLIHHGLFVELDGFKYHVFLDFREVTDDEYAHFSQLADYLGGAGVPSIEQAVKEIFLKPLHQPFAELLKHGFTIEMDRYSLQMDQPDRQADMLCKKFNANAEIFINQVKKYSSSKGAETELLSWMNAIFPYILHRNELMPY
ncbi:MAG: alpha-amylase, partial [Calditrichales bacterium]